MFLLDGFLRALLVTGRKKEDIPLAESDVLRQFRPMECLLFSSRLHYILLYYVFTGYQ